MAVNTKLADHHGNKNGGYVNNGYLATELPPDKKIYSINADQPISAKNVDQPISGGNEKEAVSKRDAGPHQYTLRNTLLGCAVCLMSAFLVALGQSCIQVS